MRAIVAPGMGVTDIAGCGGWYAWIAGELRARGVECDLHDFPEPEYAHESRWIPFMRWGLGARADTVVIGHSTGAVAALRLAEMQQLAGIAVVSAYSSHLGDPDEQASGYFDKEWNWEAIREHCGFILQLHAQDDPLVPVDEARYVHHCLGEGSHYIETETGGHFMQEQLPELLEPLLQHILG
eukprot:m51a1_g8063 hypothetical protein (183) ;mRNA; r:143871-144530